MSEKSSAFNKLSQMISEGEKINAETAKLNTIQKETQRQESMATLKEELQDLQSKKTTVEQSAKTISGEVKQAVQERRSLKQDGKETVSLAKQTGRSELLKNKAKSQEVFGENIAQLKNINEGVKSRRSNLKTNQQELADLETTIQTKFQELKTLQDQPLNERVAELEKEFQVLSDEYKVASEQFVKKGNELNATGIWVEDEKSTHLRVTGDGFGTGIDYVENINKDPLYTKKYEQERLPINRATDQLVSHLGERVLQRLSKDHRNERGEYQELVKLLLSRANTTDQENQLLSKLESSYGVNPVDFKTVRGLVHEYEQTRKDRQELSKKKEAVWKKINEQQGNQQVAEREADQLGRAIAATEKNLLSAQESLKNTIDNLELKEKEIKTLITEIEELENDLTTQREAAFQKTKDIKIPFRNSQDILSEESQQVADTDYYNYLNSLDQNINTKEQEVSDLDKKFISWNKEAKRKSIQAEIQKLEEEKESMGKFMRDLHGSREDYQRKERDIRDKKRELNQAQEYIKNASKLYIPENEKNINDLKTTLSKQQADYLEARAITKARYPNPIS